VLGNHQIEKQKQHENKQNISSSIYNAACFDGYFVRKEEGSNPE
jgi:hypothetical protein